jgi:acetyl-CoA C-acetyltransferase
MLVCRQGYRLGHGEVLDGTMKDGLWDVYKDVAMGVCAELCADNHNVTREAQVSFCSPQIPHRITSLEMTQFLCE